MPRWTQYFLYSTLKEKSTNLITNEEHCGKGLKSTDKTIVYLKILPIHNSYTVFVLFFITCLLKLRVIRVKNSVMW